MEKFSKIDSCSSISKTAPDYSTCGITAMGSIVGLASILAAGFFDQSFKRSSIYPFKFFWSLSSVP
jgi:hypothetical protein